MNWTLLLIVIAVMAGLFLLKRATFISAVKAGELLTKGAAVVDVRSPAEYRSQKVAGAINIPLDELDEKASRLLPDKSKPVLLHCLSGTRSAMAVSKLKKLGYSQVFNLGSYARAENIINAVARH